MGREESVMKRARAVSVGVAACDFVAALLYRDYLPLAVLYLLAGVLFLVAGYLTQWAPRAFFAVGATQWMALAVLGLTLGQVGGAAGSFVFGLVMLTGMFLPKRGRTPTGKGDVDPGARVGDRGRR
jgi:hypothetical protein